MPKVVITESGKPFPTSAADWHDTRYVRVGWDKPGRVQVATCDVRSGIREHPESAPGSHVPGLLVELNEESLIELVQALLRASGQAFGN